MVKQDSFLKLYNDFREVLATKTEQEAKIFLIKHLNDLPEDVRHDIIMLFFEEGLQEALDEQGPRAEVIKQGMDALKGLQKARRLLEDRIKALEIQKSIQG